MMLVDPDRRRAGIGSTMLEAELETLSSEACIRLDATPLGEPLYSRHGFVAEYQLVRLRGTVAAERFFTVDAAGRPMRPEDLGEVFAMDNEIFGDDRGRLLRTFFERAPELAWVLSNGAELLGYTFGRPGHLYTQLGPIVARDPAFARSLAAQCLSRHDGKKFTIDAPMDQPGWIAWLEAAGVTVERPFLRMRRGGASFTERRDMQFGIAGPEFG
jgi:hypothetical protein